MRVLRHWSVRHAGFIERVYSLWKRALLRSGPLLARIGRQRLEAPVGALERCIKGLTFDCQMCGECLLSSTGMACPMNCPKMIRNGPCGGVRPDGTCEVLPDTRCVWVEAWEGALRMRAGSLAAGLHPAADRTRQGTATWLQVAFGQDRAIDTTEFPSPRPSESHLESILRRGEFAVTAEVLMPDTVEQAAVLAEFSRLAGHVDALNVPDSAGANPHPSSLAVSALAVSVGLEPIYQLTTRDRNRIALQADLLGASLLGIRNILCLSGDGPQNGDHPDAKQVGDLDAMTLLDTARRLRDLGTLRSGRPLSRPPKFFLGAAANPFAPPTDWRPARLVKKVTAGAQFVQTQYCFDLPAFEEYMRRVRDLGVHGHCFILAGVGPLRSARVARWMSENVPGVRIPAQLIDRLEHSENQAAEGHRICVEMMQRIRQIEGVAGIHIMAYRQESAIPELIAASGILKGRNTPPPVMKGGQAV